MKKLTGFLIVVLTFAGAIFTQTQDPPSEKDQQLRIIKRVYNDVSDTARWEIKAQYPELRLKGDKPSEKFRVASKELVMKHVAEFKKQMESFTKDDRDFLPKGSSFYLEIGYSIEYLSDDIISVGFGKSTYTGGAHPNQRSFSLNFDLEKNKRIDLTDLFKPGSGFVKLISAESIKQIKNKQGEYYDEDWVKRGAGEKLENFASWAVTKKGLVFTFDPYQVGSYAEGPYDTVVPYEKFPRAMQANSFYNVALASYIDGNPPNWCRNGHFPKYSEFRIASVKGRKNSRAYFYGDDDTCPDGSNCRQKAYVIAGDKLIVAREYGKFVCSWYEPKKGEETVGWIRADKLAIEKPKPITERAWVGEWEDGESSIRIISEKTPGVFLIKGNAFWRGLGDNIHIGELDYPGTLKDGKLQTGSGDDKYDCRVEMQLVGGLLVVSDNLNCGGVNVSFSGIYQRKNK